MTSYKLIRTQNGYRWEPMQYRGISPKIKIETWKGVYYLDNVPCCIIGDFYCRVDPNLPILFHYRLTSKLWRHFWWRLCCIPQIAVFHPVKQKWVIPKLGVDKSFHDDIIKWIEAQSPQPDYKQAEKDRVEVEQTFSEM